MKVLVSQIRLVQALQSSMALIMRDANTGPLVVRPGNNVPSVFSVAAT